VRYRPSYPPAIVDAIAREVGISAGSRVADLGSGTGIMTRLLLARGFEVFAIEPNGPMREAAERDLGAMRGFHSIDGSAEATTLPDASVDLAIAAQAFHWFDVPKTRAELRRVVREPAWVALVWNDRRLEGPFLEAYERALLEHGTDYEKVRHQEKTRTGGQVIPAFFEGRAFREIVMENEQRFDRDGFFGRALSSSYVPQAGHPKHEAMMRALDAIFAEHASGGEVVFEYDTRAFVGRLGGRESGV